MDFPEEEVQITGVRGPLRLDDVLFAAKKASRLAPIQVVRDDRVVGPEHIRSAVVHAARALREGRAKADRPEVEFTRYLAGRRTIREAIDHMGIQDGAPSGIVVTLGPDRDKAMDYFVDALGLIEDDNVIAADMDHVRAFGITDEQIAATTPETAIDLVLEQVTSVDLMRS